MYCDGWALSAARSASDSWSGGGGGCCCCCRGVGAGSGCTCSKSVCEVSGGAGEWRVVVGVVGVVGVRERKRAEAARPRTTTRRLGIRAARNGERAEARGRGKERWTARSSIVRERGISNCSNCFVLGILKKGPIKDCAPCRYPAASQPLSKLLHSANIKQSNSPISPPFLLLRLLFLPLPLPLLPSSDSTMVKRKELKDVDDVEMKATDSDSDSDSEVSPPPSSSSSSPPETLIIK